MEQFVLVPAPVYNESSTTQATTQPQLPSYQAELITYQFDLPKKEVN